MTERQQRGVNVLNLTQTRLVYQEDSVHYFLNIVWFIRRLVYITFSILFGLPGEQCALLSQYLLVYQETVRITFSILIGLPGTNSKLFGFPR